MSSTQLARLLPRTGETYQFGKPMLGPWWGFIAGWMFLMANTVGPGIIAIAAGSYVHAAWSFIPVRVAAVFIAVVVTVINAFGIKRSVRITDVIVIISVLSLVAVVVLGSSPRRRRQPHAIRAPRSAGHSPRRGIAILRLHRLQPDRDIGSRGTQSTEQPYRSLPFLRWAGRPFSISSSPSPPSACSARDRYRTRHRLYDRHSGCGRHRSRSRNRHHWSACDHV